MDRPTLDDAFDKLRWARHHFEILKPELEALEEQDAHTISFKLNADEGKYSFHVDGLKQPDPNWGLIAGDCIHNARTALDFLMVRIYALVSGEDPRKVEGIQFPIYEDAGKFQGAVGRFKQYPLASGYIARIAELQAYNNGNPSVWGMKGHFPMFHALPTALERLSKLDNIDKHRVTHATWSQVDVLASVVSSALKPPEGFKLVAESTSAAPLENGAQIGYRTFETPLPTEWYPSQVDMQRAFPIQVTLGEWPELHNALTILALCLWGVETVLTLFAPVFAELKPPLAVTTIPNIG